MYRKILVGYDGSEQGQDALALGKLLAGSTGAELAVAGVTLSDPIWGQVDPAIKDGEVDFVHSLETAAKAAGAEPHAVTSTSPARGLHELAEEIEADLIVVGSSRHGRLGQTVAGSVGVALLHGSPCAVAIAPHGYNHQADRGIDSLVVGFDGSSEAGLAVMAASRLARETGAKLKLVSVAEPPIGTWKGGGEGWHALKETIEQAMREALTEACEAVPDGVEAEPMLVAGEPARALAEIAHAPGTVLMVGSRGYGPLRRVLLGSVSQALVRSASAPLIVTPRGVHEPARKRQPEAVETTSRTAA